LLRFGKYNRTLTLLILLLSLCLDASGQRPPNETKFLGQRPGDIEVFDSQNNRFKISDFVNDMPVLLSPIYTKCPSSCSIITANLKEAVKKSGGLGEKYKVLTFSFDYNDTPKDLKTFEKRWKLDDENWKVVASDKENTEKILASIDFEIIKDTVLGDFYHPNVVIVISPGMKISRFVYGAFPNARDINMSVLEAKQEKTSLSLYEGFLLNCFRFDQNTKKFIPDWAFILQFCIGFSFIGALLIFLIKDYLLT
jgi:protein SCO1